MFFGLNRITAPPPLRTLPQCRPVPHYQAVHDYAKAHRLEYAWEGTAAFEERLHTMSPEQLQVLAVHIHERITQVMLYAPDCAGCEAGKPR
jgi:hypothetical protein